MAQKRINVPSIPQFWPVYGEQPQVKWKVWLMLLKDYFQLTAATNTAPLEDVDKIRMLRLYLGAEGLRQFMAHPIFTRTGAVSYDDYLEAAISIFDRPANIVLSFHEFVNRKQQPNETVQDYILALRTLIADCEFFGKEDYMLALQIASGCYNQDV